MTTEGGIKAILDAVNALRNVVTPTEPLPQRKPAARKPAAAKTPAGHLRQVTHYCWRCGVFALLNRITYWCRKCSRGVGGGWPG